MYFNFEKFDLYQVALNFVVSADDVAQKLPRGRRYLKDQQLRIVAMLTPLTMSVSAKSPHAR